MAEIYEPTPRQCEVANIHGELDPSVFRGSNIKPIRALRRQFAELGLSQNIADLAVGYQEEDLPFIYVNQKDQSTYTALMVATKRPIQEIITSLKYLDQSPDVLVQWSRKHTGQIGKTILVREEIEEIQPGIFVHRTYQGVTDFGSFDGRLTQLLILAEDPQVRVEMCPDKKGYQVNGYKRNNNVGWRNFGSNTTILLDGLGKLIGEEAELEKILEQVNVVKYLPEETNPVRLDPITIALPPQPGVVTETRSWSSLKRTCREMGLHCFRGGDSLWAVGYRKDGSGKLVKDVIYQWDRNGRLVKTTDCNPTGPIKGAFDGISHMTSTYAYDDKGRLVGIERRHTKTDGTEYRFYSNEFRYLDGSNRFELKFKNPEFDKMLANNRRK